MMIVYSILVAAVAAAAVAAVVVVVVLIQVGQLNLKDDCLSYQHTMSINSVPVKYPFCTSLCAYKCNEFTSVMGCSSDSTKSGSSNMPGYSISLYSRFNFFADFSTSLSATRLRYTLCVS